MFLSIVTGVKFCLNDFYSYPPVECEWPWILRNIKQKPLENTKHEIVDIGIYDLLQEPHRHSEEKLQKWTEISTEGWKVVPDCPDLHGEFGKLIDFDNVEYSWDLLTEYYDPKDKSQLPVIQSHYEQLSSFKEYITRFKDVYGEPDKIAIGSICKSNNNDIAIQMLKIARREFPNSWIHAFGLRFRQFRRAYKLIDSFDSTSWTFPRQSGHSCKNKEERIQYFWDYINIIEGINVHLHKEQTQLEVLRCV